MPRPVAPEEMTGFGDEETFTPPGPAPKKATTDDNRRAYNEGRQHAREGLPKRDRRPDEPDELFEAYEAGHEQALDEERQRSRGRRHKTGRTPAPSLLGSRRFRRASSRAASTSAAAVGGTVTSWPGVLLGMLGLIALYFALTHAAGIAALVTWLVGVLTWLRDPKATI